ncbi:MAG: IS1634 family transposase [Thermoplasmataceae archaeon]
MDGLNASDLDLRTGKITAIPIINHYLDRMGVEEMFSSRLDGGGQITHSKCLTILLRNIILERKPVYGIGKWVSRFEPSLLGLSAEQLQHMNDDRIGRILDLLFDADRSSMLIEIAKRTVQRFGINMDEFHNDSTTITFSGDYSGADGSDKRGKASAAITLGHNKDYRPDLKQLLWTLTVSSDHSVPVHYMALDGNTPDSNTHIDTWNFLKEISGRTDFLYIADSKLCSRENMRYIDEYGGRFITILPSTRSEVSWFHEYIQEHDIEWTDAFAKKRSKGDIEFSVSESPLPSSEGFRIVWVWSSQKEELDSETRDRNIRRSVSELTDLESSLQRRRMKKERIIKKAEKAVSDIPYVRYEISEEKTETYRQSKRGRPSDETVYKKISESVYHISWSIGRELIEKDSRSDGIFPLITNCRDIDASEILARYKYQPMLEKRYEQLKTVYSVMPVLFKSITRIEGFLFLYFVAMLIQALIERDARIAMDQRSMKSIPIYSEERECFSPTSDRIMSEFHDIEVHRLVNHGNEVRSFYTEFSDLQKLIMSLLGVSEEEFRPE